MLRGLLAVGDLDHMVAELRAHGLRGDLVLLQLERRLGERLDHRALAREEIQIAAALLRAGLLAQFAGELREVLLLCAHDCGLGLLQRRGHLFRRIIGLQQEKDVARAHGLGLLEVLRVFLVEFLRLGIRRLRSLALDLLFHPLPLLHPLCDSGLQRFECEARLREILLHLIHRRLLARLRLLLREDFFKFRIHRRGFDLDRPGRLRHEPLVDHVVEDHLQHAGLLVRRHCRYGHPAARRHARKRLLELRIRDRLTINRRRDTCCRCRGRCRRFCRGFCGLRFRDRKRGGGDGNSEDETGLAWDFHFGKRGRLHGSPSVARAFLEKFRPPFFPLRNAGKQTRRNADNPVRIRVLRAGLPALRCAGLVFQEDANLSPIGAFSICVRLHSALAFSSPVGHKNPSTDTQP